MCHYDQSCNQLVEDPSIQWQRSNHCHKNCPKRMVFQIPLGQHKSLLIMAQSSSGMNPRRCWMILEWRKIPSTATTNLQANAIVEQVHQTIGNIIQTLELHDNYLDEDNSWKGILAATAFIICAAYHTTSQKSLGILIFGRDMIFIVQHSVNWEYIGAGTRRLIQKNN
jgi:hypothetical protein